MGDSMPLKQMLALVVSILLCLSLALAQDPDHILYMTEDYPPYNFMEDGSLKGISVDLMMLMLEKLESKVSREDIRLYPWPRAYQLVQNKAQTCLFAMTKTEAREKLFKWVGPFFPEQIVLIALKVRNIRINSIQALDKYKIGVVTDDIAELILAEKKIPKENIHPSPHPEQIVRKLNADRIDMWAYGDIVGMWIIKKIGLNPQDFEIVYPLGVAGDNYFAFHRETSDHLIEKFQTAFDGIQKQGKYLEILDRYLK